MYSLKREAVEALKGESVKAWKRGRSVGRFNPSTLQPFNAFTLLELLIAVSIFAMVLTAINGVFYGAMRLQSKSSRAVEESLPAQQTVALLKRDLQGIVAPGGVLGGSFQSGVSTASTIASTVPPGSTTFYTCTGVIDETSPWA